VKVRNIKEKASNLGHFSEVQGSPEGLSYGRHAEDDVKVGPDSLEEESIEVVLSLPGSCSLGRIPHFVKERSNLILGEKVGDLARSEDVVHVLKEGLMDNLRRSEERERERDEGDSAT